FDDVMAVSTAENPDVHRRARMICKGTHPVLVEPIRQLSPVVKSTAHVDRGMYQGFVHRHHLVAVTGRGRGNHLADRSPNRNRHVFHEVMSEVSARLDSEVQSGIARERGQHVIEKAMPRGHIRFSASARHFNANLCFRRLPNDHAHGSNSLSITKYTWE